MKIPFPPNPEDHARAVDYIKSLKRKSNETELDAVLSAMQSSYHLAWMFAILLAVTLVGSNFWLAAFKFLISLGFFLNGMKLGKLLELFNEGTLVEREVNQSTPIPRS
ncbi:MAG: hypothetical protein NWS71_11250 [Opitutales bacterium]|jgi:hypothetical protein|nr:hypothetical protein [Opitutales bacterium]MDP4884090.1 hypothetical protein [Opitutales bacterium]